jgi:hypothetical protein
MWCFFLNFSRLLKDFRKIKNAMPCNASYARFFWKDFYMHNNSICNLYALLCWQNFILPKIGCYNMPPLARNRRPPDSPPMR